MVRTPATPPLGAVGEGRASTTGTPPQPPPPPPRQQPSQGALLLRASGASSSSSSTQRQDGALPGRVPPPLLEVLPELVVLECPLPAGPAAARSIGASRPHPSLAEHLNSSPEGRLLADQTPHSPAPLGGPCWLAGPAAGSTTTPPPVSLGALRRGAAAVGTPPLPPHQGPSPGRPTRGPVVGSTTAAATTPPPVSLGALRGGAAAVGTPPLPPQPGGTSGGGDASWGVVAKPPKPMPFPGAAPSPPPHAASTSVPPAAPPVQAAQQHLSTSLLFGSDPASLRELYGAMRARYLSACSTAGLQPVQRFSQALAGAEGKSAAQQQLRRSHGTPSLSKVMLSHLGISPEMLHTIGGVLGMLCADGSPVEAVLSHNPVSPAGISAFLRLSAPANIAVLELFSCGLTDEACEPLSQALEKNPPLLRLKLGDNRLTCKGVLMLCRGIASSSSLKQLHLGGNPIGDRGVGHLVEKLGRHISLASWGLRDAGVTAEGVSCLARCIADPHCRLAEANIRLNRLTPPSAILLGSALQGNRSLRLLDASSCGISGGSSSHTPPPAAPPSGVGRITNGGEAWNGDGIAALASGISTSRLAEVILSGNTLLGSRGVVRICSAVSAAGSPIATLLLEETGMRADAVRAVAGLVAASQTLRHLSLRENPIGSGIAELAEAVSASNSLEILNVSHCGISPNGSAALALSVWQSRTLRSVDHSSNTSGGVGGSAWAKALTSNPTLTRLALTDNGIPPEAVREMQAALNGNTALLHFSFGGQSVEPPRANRVPAAARAGIGKLLQGNRVIAERRGGVIGGGSGSPPADLGGAEGPISEAITAWLAGGVSYRVEGGGGAGGGGGGGGNTAGAPTAPRSANPWGGDSVSGNTPLGMPCEPTGGGGCDVMPAGGFPSPRGVRGVGGAGVAMPKRGWAVWDDGAVVPTEGDSKAEEGGRAAVAARARRPQGGPGLRDVTNRRGGGGGSGRGTQLLSGAPPSVQKPRFGL